MIGPGGVGIGHPDRAASARPARHEGRDSHAADDGSPRRGGRATRGRLPARLLLLVGIATCWLVPPPAHGDFLGLALEALTFEDQPGWEDEFLVIDVFAAFDEPTDELNVVFGEPGNHLILTTSDPLGFMNATLDGLEHPFGQGPPLEYFLELIPAFNWDTFATFGITSYFGGLPFAFSPGFERYPLEGTEVVIDNGAWFVVPGGGTGLAGSYPDLEVRILRLSFRQPACVAGRINVVVLTSEGGSAVDGLGFAACTTPSGAGIEVDLDTPAGSHVVVTYEQVLADGITLLTSQPHGPPLPPDVSVVQPPIVHTVGATTSYAGTVEVCVAYDDSLYANEPIVRLLHLDGGSWTDVTTSLDQAGDVVCGQVADPSSFVVVEVADPLAGAIVLITELYEAVAGLAIPPGIMNSLLVQVAEAWIILADEHVGNDAAAAGILGAFLNHVNAQRGKHLPAEVADGLVLDVQDIVGLLGVAEQSAP
jgi:hypothetical protein